jgi:2-methylcitrate dehydratase PrpD
VKRANRAAQAALDATVTIGARLGKLSTSGSPAENALATHEMVSEKVSAAIQGAMGAQLAWGSLFFRTAMGGMTSPMQLFEGLAGVADAAAAPALKRVRHNARRYTGLRRI